MNTNMSKEEKIERIHTLCEEIGDLFGDYVQAKKVSDRLYSVAQSTRLFCLFHCLR